MRCNGCGEDLSVESFSWKNKAKGTRMSRCKRCVGRYNAEWHARQGPERNRRIYESNLRTKQAHMQIINEIKTRAGCADCGETDPIVLDFDHIGDDKVMGVAQMLTKRLSIELILSEIAKCEVVCSNCHRRRTHRRLAQRRRSSRGVAPLS